MHGTDADRPKRPGREPHGPAEGKDRFDGESARRILQRAAAEQQRLCNELSDSWSLEELEEMAEEAGISSEALLAAVETHESNSGTAAAGTPLTPRERPRRSAAGRLKPGNWSTAATVGVLTAGGIGFLGSLLVFPAVAETVLWVLLLLAIVISVLIVLGASPF